MEAGRVNPSLELEDIRTQCSKLTNLISEQYAKLEEEREILEREKENFNAAHKIVSSFKDPIKLNIGGTIFMTSKSTILTHDSMLSAMFSGRHALEKGEDGAYFIDRDPKHFGRILNFLRDGEFQVPKDELEKYVRLSFVYIRLIIKNNRKEILREAEYYSMTGLIEYLSGEQIPLRFDPSRKAPNVVINGTVATSNFDSWQHALTESFSRGLHSCTFQWTGMNPNALHIMIGVNGANIDLTDYGVFTQPQSMMLNNVGALYVAGKKKKSNLTSYKPGLITVEVNCEKQTVTWIYDTSRYNEPMPNEIQAPFSFCVDLWKSTATITAIQ